MFSAATFTSCNFLDSSSINSDSSSEETSELNSSSADNNSSSSVTEKNETSAEIDYKFADKTEATALMLSNTAYHDSFSQHDLDFRVGKSGATKAEFLEMLQQQAVDFTDEEKAVVDASIERIEALLVQRNMELPVIDQVVFIKTKMQEEAGARAYTLGTQIYLQETVLNVMVINADNTDAQKNFDVIICHELFHCITRNNSEFKKDIYEVIDFTISDTPLAIGSSLAKDILHNPDVDGFYAYSEFTINGEKKDCYMAMIVTNPYSEENTSMFRSFASVLIPVDTPDVYYETKDVSDFFDVMGENTGYTIDPEECLADNFSFSILFGAEFPGEEEYPTPEIIEDIINLLTVED